MNLQIQTDESGRKYISDDNLYHIPIPKNITFTEKQLSDLRSNHTVEVLNADKGDALEYIGYKIMYVKDISDHPVLVPIYKAVFPKKAGLLCGVNNAYITETDFSEYEGCGIHYSFKNFALKRDEWCFEMWDEVNETWYKEPVSPLMNPDAISALIIDGYAEDKSYRNNFESTKEDLESNDYDGKEYSASEVEEVLEDRGLSTFAHDLKLVEDSTLPYSAIGVYYGMKIVKVYKKYNEDFELIEVDENGNEIIASDIDANKNSNNDFNDIIVPDFDDEVPF